MFLFVASVFFVCFFFFVFFFLFFVLFFFVFFCVCVCVCKSFFALRQTISHLFVVFGSIVVLLFIIDQSIHTPKLP